MRLILMAEKVRMHTLVEGSIWGGDFARAVQRAAMHLGINGRIKQISNRKAKIIAEGDRRILEHPLEEVRYGEGATQITSIQTIWKEATGEFTGFLVR